MPPRLFVDLPLSRGQMLSLPAGAARHVQVLRLQPGSPVTLFNGRGGEWSAEVADMGRTEVAVQLGELAEVNRELPIPVTLAVGMPANDRMDTLVEKATELGVAAVQPLICQRSVLRLSGDRASKKVAHWQAVAQAACEQSGRTAVPIIAPVRPLADWLAALPSAATEHRVLLGFGGPTKLTASPIPAVCSLSGPEGGLTPEEESAAQSRGFALLSLGPRVLRADTAPLALLAALGLPSLL
jgi:16S rRNA (uracil1498-N3)-methyltransferase